MPVVLVVTGPPGAPSRDFAALVQERVAVPVVVTDDEISVLAGGRDASELLIEDGEARFRDLEHQAIVGALDRLGRGRPGILVLGGGALMVEANQQLVQGLPLAFLDPTITEASKVLGLNLVRTTTIVNPRAQWLRMFAERRPVYERFASVTVPIDGTPLAELVDRVLPLLPDDLAGRRP